MSNITRRPIYQKGQGTAAKKGAKSPLRSGAEGKDCTLRLDGCCNDRATVVLCHIRRFGWAGMGIKPNDLLAFHGCAHCHRNETQATDTDLLRAHGETLIAMLNDGSISIREHSPDQ